MKPVLFAVLQRGYPRLLPELRVWCALSTLIPQVFSVLGIASLHLKCPVQAGLVLHDFFS